MRHAPDFDSNIELVQYRGGDNAPLDHTDMTASSTRDEENNLTTFDLEIPWDALTTEPPEPGDTLPWGINASDNEEVDGEIQYLGGWGFGSGMFLWPIHPDTNQVSRLLADRPGEIVLTGNDRPSWYPIRVRV